MESLNFFSFEILKFDFTAATEDKKFNLKLQKMLRTLSYANPGESFWLISILQIFCVSVNSPPPFQFIKVSRYCFGGFIFFIKNLKA